MSTKKLSKGEAIRFGWNTAKNNLGFFIALVIVVNLPSLAIMLMAETVSEANVIAQAILYIIVYVLAIIISMGAIKVILRFCDNEKGGFADLFSQYRLLFGYLFGGILYGLIVFGGMLLLIVPGIIWGIKFSLFPYLIIDKGLGPIDALQRSSAITRGAKWDLFVFSLMITGINLLGALFLLIGLFITIPMTAVAMAFVYRKLLAQTDIAPMHGASAESISAPQSAIV